MASTIPGTTATNMVDRDDTGRTARKTAAAPRRPVGSTTTGPAAGAVQPQRMTLDQHLKTVAECEVMTPAELYTYLESLRSLCSGLAFFVHTAASQLDAAARKGARDAADGRMTLAQKAKQKIVLRRMGRLLKAGTSDALLAAATSAVKSWGVMQEFLDELESLSVQRPHRSARGGFDFFGGN